jgi:hypothetical protein
MNERIRELWTQAGGHYNGGNQHTWPEYTIDDPEKFAELIIRECMKVALDERVSDEEIDKSDDIEDRCYLRGNNGGVVDAVVAIKQHFGVEE